jgi:hypothetical protein
MISDHVDPHLPKIVSRRQRPEWGACIQGLIATDVLRLA